MATEKDSRPDNPPAFPDSVAVDHMDGLNFSRHMGMTLRDYFAAKAMQTLLPKTFASDAHGMVASVAYDIADAMLAERAK